MAKRDEAVHTLNRTGAEAPAKKSHWRRNWLLNWLPGWLLALAFFALATAAFTWPLTIKLWDTLPDWGDPPDVAWKLGFIARNLLSNPFQLNQNPFFYPLTDSI